MDFAISDQAYAKAKVPITDSVNLWLGANVMLEYPLEEAKALLVTASIASFLNTSWQSGIAPQQYPSFCSQICRHRMFRIARKI